MMFCEAPASVRGLLDLTFFIQFILLVTALLANVNQKRVLPVFLRNLIMIIMSVLVFLFYQLGVGLENKIGPVCAEYVAWFSSLPLWIVIGISLSLSIELGIYLYYSFSWADRHITAASVKEAIDNLPGGTCIFEDTGRIVIKNTAISDVARKMTGHALLDGIAFEKAVKEYERTTLIGDKYVAFLQDDSIWSFTFDDLDTVKEQYRFIMCSDITEEYKKTEELEKTQREVMNLNIRLTEYNQEIISAISEREVLDAKVKIHDELGTGLLSIKHYLTMGGTEEEKEQIMERIKRNINYLKSETEHKVSDEYELMISTAKTLGVEIEVDGVLPEEEPCKHVIATAMHECFTNTLRHAGGNLLMISITKNDGVLKAVFTNNGNQPKEKINEKGGLMSLHTLVTQSGGTMEIVSMPIFMLKISMPYEEE